METPVSLLERLHRPGDGEAWARFVQLYTPLLYSWLRRNGCPEHETADLVQDVFVTLVQVLPNFAYDRHKSFRRWLRTVALNRWRDRLKRSALPCENGNWAERLAADESDPFWEKEYRAQLARRALEIMQKDFPGQTWRACWEVLAMGRPAPEVAAEFGLTPGAVHAARFRVLERLRRELAGLLE
jgi:RNA polymerase sigma-70 factor (ECF subfamily)